MGQNSRRRSVGLRTRKNKKETKRGLCLAALHMNPPRCSKSKKEGPPPFAPCHRSSTCRRCRRFWKEHACVAADVGKIDGNSCGAIDGGVDAGKRKDGLGLGRQCCHGLMPQDRGDASATLLCLLRTKWGASVSE